MLLLLPTTAWSTQPSTWYVSCDQVCPGNCLAECPAGCIDDCPQPCTCPIQCNPGDPDCPAECEDDCPAYCPIQGTQEQPFSTIATALTVAVIGDTVLVLPTDDDPDRLRVICDPSYDGTLYDPEGNCSFCDPSASVFQPECCPGDPVFDISLCNPPLDCVDPETAPDCAPDACHENVSMVSGINVMSTEGPTRTTILAALENSPAVVASALVLGTTLDGFTITGGRGRLGGGIQTIFGSPTISNNIIEGNVVQGEAGLSGRGGGIYMYITGGEITDNIIRYNVAGNPSPYAGDTEVQNGGLGGAIMTNLSTPLISRNLLQGNVALASASPYSGFVYGYGGAIEAWFGVARISDNLIISNMAGLGGGGVDLYGGSPTVVNNTIDGNCAGIGEVMPADCSTLDGSVTAFAYGGGIEMVSTVIPTLLNNMVTSNVSQGKGGGLDVFPSPGPPDLRMQANLFDANDSVDDDTTDQLSGLQLCDDGTDGDAGSELRGGFTCADDSTCQSTGGAGVFDFCFGGAQLLSEQVGGQIEADPAYLNPPAPLTPCDPADPLSCDFHIPSTSVAVDGGRDGIRECTDGTDVFTGSGIACAGAEELVFLIAVAEEDLDRQPRTVRLQSNPNPYLFRGTDLGAYEYQPGTADDLDGDGILDDGDGSGIVGDAPCTGGNKVNCDDNCVNVKNAGQVDSDEEPVGTVVGDGVGDACDLCKLVPDPDQIDLDGDGQGDLCDPDLDNDLVLEDGDGSGDPTDNPCASLVTEDCDDNCQDINNPTQLDTDGDLVGDSCDCTPADDSEFEPPAIIEDTLGFTPGSSTQLEWAAADNADKYHLYRGSFEILFQDWNYTQDPSIVNEAAEFCDLPDTFQNDPFQPALGRAVYYLVVSANACGQTILGEDSAGNVRFNSFACVFIP